MATAQQPQAAPAASTSTTNPVYGWDNKPLRFICDNPTLKGQAYVLCDGQPKMAFRGGSYNARMSLAPMVETPDPDGTDYEKSASQFLLGPVYLSSDDSLFNQAAANPGVEVSASPRGPSALKTISLDPAVEPPTPAAPKTLAPEQQRHARSVMQVIEAEAIAGVHGVESVAGKAWAELKNLLHV